MNGRRTRSAVVTALAAGLALSAAACGSSGSGGGKASATTAGPITITVGCEPPTSQATARKNWEADVAAFEKANPGVTVKGDDSSPCDDPATFDAKLASGRMDDVFYTYFTDGANVISSGQAADIQQYATQITEYKDI